MKRSEARTLPSQETSSKMSRHDLETVEETETPNTNIFLVENVLRRLFKQIESVSKLKELRRMCQIWDKVDTEELEERAIQGRFKPINLTFFDEKKDQREFKSIKDSSFEMKRFLDDTSSNPRLFRSFIITFPGSLAFLNLHNFRWFYTEYSPTFLELAITSFQFNQDKELILKELLRWAAPTLRGLVIKNNSTTESDLIPTSKSLPVQSFNFPHLRKVRTTIYMSNGIAQSILDAFKVIFTKENHPETPSLTSLSLRCAFPADLLELNSNPSRWATLTKLDIFYGHILCDNGGDGAHNYERFNQFTDGLLSIARAGMTLKKLDLGLRLLKDRREEDPYFVGTCRNLSQFFASQARSLEVLKLDLKLILSVSIGKYRVGKIQIPIFERLHTLSLNLDNCVYTNRTIAWNIFEIGSISQHFPALENLNLLNFGGSLDGFLEGSYGAEERLNLKCLKIPIELYWVHAQLEDGHFEKYFRSIETFGCTHDTLEDFGMLGDLVETIRVLHIRDVTSELDLSQFKGLKRVVIEEDDKAESSLDKKKLNVHKGEYLGYFQKIAELGLDSIKFRGLEMIEGESYKKFAEGFPFRVEFEDKPVADWLFGSRLH